MINDKQIETIFQIFKQVSPKISDSLQLYDSSYSYRPGHIVKLTKNRTITAVWLDFPDVNEWKLRVLFKRHKEVPHQFFIKQVDNFYRIGWKAII